jgi:hypothetical protein
MLKKKPDYLKVVIADKVNDIVDMAVFAFKDVMTKKGKNYSYFDIWNSHKRYYSNFLTLACNMCKIVYDINPETRFKSFEFLRICSDYFESLLEFCDSKSWDFKVYNISSVPSMEAFQDWCIKEYGSLEDYFNSFKKKEKSKLKETADEEKEEIELVPHSNIKGLSEIVF